MANNTNDEEFSNETGSDKSFVGKFVSGLISNTPLSKWFNKTGNNNNNNSVTKPVIRRRGDDDDDDDDEDDSFVAQPPMKRAKLPTLNDTTTTTTPTKVTQTNPSSNNVKVFNSFLEPIAGPSGIIQRRKLFINNIDRNQSGSNIEQNNDTDDSDDDEEEEEEDEEETTSGYSSSAPLKLPTTTKTTITQENNDSNRNIVRKLNKEDLNAPEIDNKNSNNSSNNNNSRTNATIKSLFNSSQDGSRSLFSERSLSPNISKNNNNNNISLSTRRPNFNPSISGATNFVDKTLTTKRILNSPFYNGRTMYGGASSLNLLSSLNTTKTIDNNRSTSSVIIKPINKKLTNSDNNTTLSKTARRILNTLEQYSTPISDAKKIPISPKNNDKSSTNNRRGILSKYIGANPYILPPKKSSNRELQIPDLLQMKQKERLQNSTENFRQIAITSKSDLNQNEYKLPHNNNDDNNDNKQQNKQTKYVNKIKNNIRQQNKIQLLQNEIIKLPNVTLPITTLPKFDFVLPPPSPQQQQQQQQIKDKSTVKVSPKKSNDDNLDYKFSKPVVISDNFKTIQAINCFKFSEPLDKKQKLTNKTTINFKMPEITTTTTKLPIPKLKNNGENCIVKPAPELITTGSCVDILKNNNLDKFKPNKDTWECIACLVRNDNDKNVCIACEMEREKSSTNNNNNQSSFGDKFKPLPTTWECPTCMIRNKNELNKCEACQTDNPNNKKSTITTTTTFNFGIKSTNNDTWECSSCWVRNKNDTDKCIACQSVRNKPQNSASSESQKQQFNFGDKFKLQSLQTWECPTCMIRNKNELNKCEACETLKPNNEQTNSQFSFGIQSLNNNNNDWECKSCKIKNKITTNKCNKCGILKDANNVNKGFGDLFKLKQSEWECTSCLVRNNNNVIKCACCGILKPDNCNNDIDTNNIKTEKTTISFNFGIDNKQNNFKFGIPTTSTTTTTTNEQTTSFIFGAPTTTTTTTSSTNSFSFGIKPQIENKTNTEKIEQNKAESAVPVPSFKFGVDSNVGTSPKTNETTTTLPKKIEIPASLSADNLSKKPTFEFKPVNGDINKPNLFASTTVTTTTTITSPSTTSIASSSKKDNIFGTKPAISATVTTSAPLFKFTSDSNISTTKTTTTTATVVGITTPIVAVTTSSSEIFKFGSANIQSTAISSTKRSFGDVSSSSENKTIVSNNNNSNNNKFGSIPAVTTIASPKLPTFELPKTTTSFGNSSGSNTDNKTINFGGTTKSLSFGTASTTTTTSSSSSSSGFGSMVNDIKFGTSLNPTSKPSSFGVSDNKQLGTFSFGNTTDTNKTVNFGSLEQKKTVSFGGNSEQKHQLTGFGLNNNSSFGNETKPTGFGVGGSNLSNSKPVFGISDPKPSLISNFGTTDNKPTFGTTPPPPSAVNTIESKSNIFGNTDTKSTSFGTVSSSVQKPIIFGTSEPPKPFSFGNPIATPPPPTTNTATVNQSKSTSFTFGQQQQPNENKLNEVPQPFKFSGNDTNAGGFNFAMTPAVPNTTFNFGSATKTETTQQQQQQQPAQNQGIFGGNNSSISNNNNSNNNGASWAKSGSFNFGTTANNNNQKAIFTFGASQTTQQQTSFSTPQQQQPTNTVAPTAAVAQTTGFNFGASAPTVSTGGFNFTGPMPTFNFTDGAAANTAQPQRKLRKALRRIPR